MPRYLVTTVENVYETYAVEAPNEAAAVQAVQCPEARAILTDDSYPDGGNDDVEIVVVREVYR